MLATQAPKDNAADEGKNCQATDHATSDSACGSRVRGFAGRVVCALPVLVVRAGHIVVRVWLRGRSILVG